MKGLMRNGDFKFFLNGKLLVDDVDPHDSTWKTERFEITHIGVNEFTWIYKKYYYNEDHELTAEIKDLKIVGIEES